MSITKEQNKRIWIILIISLALVAISTTTINAASVKYATGSVNSRNGAILRKSSSTSSARVATLNNNAKITIKSEVFKSKTSKSKTKRWYYVSYGSKSGYIRADLVDGIKYNKVSGKTTDSVNYRAGAGVRMNRYGTLSKGTSLKVCLKTKAAGSKTTWYKVYCKGKYAYVASSYVKLTATTSAQKPSTSTSSSTTQTSTSTSASAQSDDFEAYMTKQGFPESYKSKLRALHKAHPKWTFVAQKVGVSFDSAVSKESANGVSLINGVYDAAYRDTSSSSYTKGSGRKLYTSASTSSKVKCTVEDNVSFTTLSAKYNGSTLFFKIKLKNGTTGYIKGAPTVQTYSSAKTGVVSHVLKVRSLPDTDGTIYKEYSVGTKISIVLAAEDGRGRGWYMIRYGQSYGYVLASYVTVDGQVKAASAVAYIDVNAFLDNYEAKTESAKSEIPDEADDHSSEDTTSDELDSNKDEISNTNNDADISTETEETIDGVGSDSANSDEVSTESQEEDSSVTSAEETSEATQLDSDSEVFVINEESDEECIAETETLGDSEVIVITEDETDDNLEEVDSEVSVDDLVGSGSVEEEDNEQSEAQPDESVAEGEDDESLSDANDESVEAAESVSPVDETALESEEEVATVQAMSSLSLTGSGRNVDGKFKAKDGSTWFNARKCVVEYYMDPRNFLNEDRIYMFETLSYSSYQTQSTVSKVLSGTKFTSYGYSAKTFYNAGKKYKVSPVFLAARARQESGNGSIAMTGYSIGGVKYYNPFNIGATSGSNPVVTGMYYAKSKGWNTQTKAVNGAASILASGYIGNKQDTLYTQKFNVANGASKIATHQYMTNVMAAYSEALSTKNAYKSYGIVDEALVFKIPVYTNMPSKTSLPK